MSKASSALFIDYDQYIMGFAGPRGYSCNKTHPNGLSNALDSSVYRGIGLCRKIIGNYSCQYCRGFSTSISVLFSLSEWRGWAFSRLHFKMQVMRAKVGTNPRMIYRRARNDLRSVTTPWCSSCLIALIAFVKMQSLSGRISWPK